MWQLFGFFLGVIGGLSGAEIVLAPVTLVLPAVLVAVARRHHEGSAALLGHAAGLLVFALWLLSLQTGSGHTVAGGALIIAGVLLVLGVLAALVSRTRFVRGSHHGSH